MKLNKKRIEFYPIPGKECEYCGVDAFAHVHNLNTLPKDFEIIHETSIDKMLNTCRECQFDVEDNGHSRACSQFVEAEIPKFGTCLCDEPISPEKQKQIDDEWKKADMPMGVSEWRAIGMKFGYWDYFAKEVGISAVEEYKRGMIQYGKDYVGAEDPTCWSAEAFELANNLIFALEKYER